MNNICVPLCIAQITGIPMTDLLLEREERGDHVGYHPMEFVPELFEMGFAMTCLSPYLEGVTESGQVCYFNTSKENWEKMIKLTGFYLVHRNQDFHATQTLLHSDVVHNYIVISKIAE